jgi:hypothetical protein
MARIPTTEFCPQCEAETPPDVLKKSGRVRTRVFQDLDSGAYECAKGHSVDLGPVMPAMDEEAVPFHEPPPVVSRDAERASQPAPQTAVMVEEEPQSSQAQILPGSMVRRQGGSIEMVLKVPEQYAEPLLEYCRGIGKDPETYVNEVIENAFDNGWFL